jgi:hypothetical protein
MAKKPNAADESEQPSAETAPEEQPMAAEKPAEQYVPEDQQFADYVVTMSDERRKATIYIPMQGFPGGFPVTFMRPDQTSRTVNTSAACARQLKIEGWSVEKAS